MATFTADDLAYLHANYLTLDELCAERPESPADVVGLIERRALPRPSYVLDDGGGMFPADYFGLLDAAGSAHRLPEHFGARYRAACGAHEVSSKELAADWEAYLDGTYGICLREVTPETIVRKSVLVASLCQLLVLAQPRDPSWRHELRTQVAELDSLERDFAPDYDRSADRLRPPTRDLLIAQSRRRFPDVFPEAA